MPEQDVTLLIAVRTDDLPSGIPEGGAEALCDDCHESVAWTPATVAMVRDLCLPVHVRCTQCAQRLGDGGRPEPPTEAQRLEIAAATGLSGDQLDRAIEDLLRLKYGGPGVGP